MARQLLLAAFTLLFGLPACAGDYAGLWKSNCTDPYGLSIEPAADNKYLISSCGPGGCRPLEPLTTIDGDPMYRVVDAETLELRENETKPWLRLKKCAAQPNPELELPSAQAQAQPSPPAPAQPGTPPQPPRRGIKLKAYYAGLPDYEKNPVFKTGTAGPHRMLRAALPKAAAPLCVRGVLEGKLNVEAPELKTNLCDPSAYAKVRNLVLQLAPSLDPARLTFRTVDLDRDGEPELLVEYIDLPPALYRVQEGGRVLEEVHPIPDVEHRDPYLSLWLLKFDGTVYRTTYAGHFLAGAVHAEAPFGQDGSHRMIFIRHQSCTECHASTYLTVVDFFRDAGFVFSYDEAHSDFTYRIEYALAGKGHTVNAEVETRVLPASPKGPHLMQQFRLDDGKVEWWVFRCVDLKCDYEMHLGALPSRYRKAWQAGRKL